MFERYALIAILSAVLFGGSAVFQKRGMREIPELKSGWWNEEGKLRWDRIGEVVKNLLNVYFVTAIVIGIGASLSYLISMSMGEISIVQPITAFGNFVTVLLGVLWLGETLVVGEYFGISLVMIGIILLNLAA